MAYMAMSESFLSRLLPNTGWGLRLTSLIPASRWGFALGTLAVNIVVASVCLLVATQTLPLGSKPIALMGLAAQMALIRKRESDIQPKRRWRFWYAAVFAVLAFTWVDGAMGIGHEDRIRTISQVVLGGFLMFQLLILPVTVSCCVHKAPSP
jgi:Mn2+/Fe2+ NRAMP family transporter